MAEHSLTIKDLAKEAGLSESWVRKVVNRMGLGIRVGGGDRRGTITLSTREVERVLRELGRDKKKEA